MADLVTLLEELGWATPARDTGWCSVRCGAHDDTHASARVNVELGVYYCHACGLSAGSPTKLLMTARHLDYATAKAALAAMEVGQDDAAQVIAGRPVRRFRQRWHRRRA